MRYDVSEFNAGKKTYPFMDLRVGDVFVFSETVYMLLWWEGAGSRVHVLRVADVSEDKLLTRGQRDVHTWAVGDALQRTMVPIIKAELKLLSYE